MHKAEHSTELPTETQPAPSAPLYQTQFEAFLENDGAPEFWSYKELYYHKDINGETDWVLVKADSNVVKPAFYNAVIGNRVIMRRSYGTPFSSGYGVYDVKADQFMNAGSAQLYGCDGFVSVFDQYGGGRLLGDIDRDDDLSIIDATMMQRCIASLREYPDDDEIIPEGGLWTHSAKYYSDFDRDGERSILDATCVQRYLAGMTYPVGKQ